MKTDIPPHILFVSSRFPYGSGEEFFTAEIESLLRSGVRITVVPLRLIGLSKKNHAPESLGTLKLCLIKFSFLKLFYELVKIFKTENNTIFRRSRFRQIAKEALASSFANQIAKFVHDQSVTHIHAFWCSSTSSFAMELASISGVSWSCTAHSGDLIDGTNLGEKFRSATFVRFISALKLSESSRFFDGAGHPLLLRLGLSLPKSLSIKNEVLPVNTLIFVGNLVELKRPHLVIEALESLRQSGYDLDLLVVGEGTLKSELIEMVERRGLGEFVDFLGRIPNIAVRKLFQEHSSSAILINSSSTGSNGQVEGCPISIVEAMSSRLMVVGSRSGGITELLSDVQLFEPDNIQSLIAVITRLIELDESKRIELIEDRLNFVEANYNALVSSQILLKLMKNKNS